MVVAVAVESMRIAAESAGGVTGAGAAAGAFVSSTGAASFAPPPHAAAIKAMASAGKMRVVFIVSSPGEIVGD